MSNDKHDEVSDAEMVMDMFRLARDGGHTTAASLKQAIKAAYPDEPQERLDRNLATLARRLLN